VIVRVSPLPNTPQLRQPRFKCPSNQRFEYVVRNLRKKLGLQDHESLFCYVNSVFAPGLDEGIGNLWRVSRFCQVQLSEDVLTRYSVSKVVRSSSSITASHRPSAEEPQGHLIETVKVLLALTCDTVYWPSISGMQIPAPSKPLRMQRRSPKKDDIGDYGLLFTTRSKSSYSSFGIG
jgi:hypothetical protein